ncbi:aldolase [Wallemia mellicola]|nr:aldolase [Wallemia mellicola]
MTIQLPRGNYTTITIIYNNDQKQTVNNQATAAHAVTIAHAGTSGIVVGSNGEHQSLSIVETNIVTKSIRDALDLYKLQDIPVITNVASQSTIKNKHLNLYASYESIERAHRAKLSGANFILLPSLAPNLSRDDNMSFFEDVAEESPIPVIIYSHPQSSAGFHLTSDEVIRLAQHPNIVGLKATDNDVGKMTRLTHLSKTNNFHVFCGSSDYLIAALSIGVHGSITAAANFAPDLLFNVWDSYNKGKAGEALDLQRKLSVVEARCKVGDVAGVKYATSLIYNTNPKPRKPLRELSEEIKEIVRSGIWLLKGAA